MTDRIGLDQQIEYSIEWIACDNKGHIALLESGGYAPIPETILRSDSNRKRCIEFVRRLPINGNAITHKEILSKIKLPIWIEDAFSGVYPLGQRGIFVYTVIDDSARIAPFERMISPDTPLHLSNLPEEIRAIITPTAMPLSFTHMQQIPFSVVDEMSKPNNSST